MFRNGDKWRERTLVAEKPRVNTRPARHPARGRKQVSRQVSWLTARASCYPFPTHFPGVSGIGRRFAVYSCGGSAGFTPASLLIPYLVDKRTSTHHMLCPLDRFASTGNFCLAALPSLESALIFGTNPPQMRGKQKPIPASSGDGYVYMAGRLPITASRRCRLLVCLQSHFQQRLDSGQRSS